LRPIRWFAGLPSTPEFNVLVFSFLLNLAWEVWQGPFFRGMADQPHWLGVKACTQATFGDAGISLAAFWFTAFFARTRSWIMRPSRLDIAMFLGVGVVVTILFEAMAIGVLGRWAHCDAMPRLPIMGTGLLPMIQWLAIPPLVLWFVRRQTGRQTPRAENRHQSGPHQSRCTCQGRPYRTWRLPSRAYFLLLWWTGDCSVAAKHTAVAALGGERFSTAIAGIEVQAGVRGHCLLLREPAEGTSDRGLQQDWVHGWSILPPLCA